MIDILFIGYFVEQKMYNVLFVTSSREPQVQTTRKKIVIWLDVVVRQVEKHKDRNVLIRVLKRYILYKGN